MKCSNQRTRAGARLVTGAVASLAAALSLAACGSTVSNTSNSGDSSAATPGYNPSTKTFNVTAIHPLSGPIASAGQGLVDGLKLYFDHVNAKGGINGNYKITLDAEDSQYNTQVAVPIYNRTKNNTALYAGILGTDILNALEPQFEADNVMTVVDTSSANFVQGKHWLPWGTTAQVNVVNLIGYAVNKLGLKDATYCSMDTPDDNGKDNIEGTQYAVKAFSLNFGVDVQPPAGTTDYLPFVKKLQTAGCDVVMFGMTTGATTGVVAAASQLNFTPQWLGQSNTYTAPFATSPIAPYLEKHWITAFIGVPWESDVPGQVQLRADVAKFAPKTPKTNWVELGYAHGLFVAAVLKKAIDNGDYSRAGIAKASAEIGNFDYDGLLPTFGYYAPGKRVTSRKSALYKISPQKGGVFGLVALDAHYNTPEADGYPVK